MNDPNTTQQTEFVLRRLLDELQLGGRSVDGRLWLALLIPVLLAGLFYACWQYKRDSQSVGWKWASGLAFLRCLVYLILAAVFLLPALQSWDETRTESKVVVLFDVSGSMGTRDDLPTPETPVEKLPTRQDKVLRLLADDGPDFLDRLQQKNPVTAYRFGGQIDEDYYVFRDGLAWGRADWEARQRENEQPVEGRKWEPENWDAWLKPLVPTEPDDLREEDRPAFRRQRELAQRLLGATNVGQSALAVLNREINNMVQGIVVFSDGHSTEGSEAVYNELAERARRAKVPFFVVAVGDDRPPIRIEISDVQAPEQARPEDKFPVRVEVTGEGLANREVTVYLDIIKPDGQKVKTLDKQVKFQPGDRPHAQAEFEIEAAKHEELATLKAEEGRKPKPELDEGEWKFVARVPRDPQEVFLKKEHVSEPATVRIVKRPLRVLLFAGAPTHEYQFVRTLFVRETDFKRAELSIYLQPAPGQDQRRPGIVQDVPPERLLTQFPYKLQDESADKPDEKNYNLAAYDLIIAFDPDWTELTAEQCGLLERWVGTHAGGLIVVGGPVNTYQLARPGVTREKIKPILDLYPVVLQDNRTYDLDRDMTQAWRLNFPGATPEMEFLRLDEEAPADAVLAGWEEFFTGHARGQAPPNAPTVRGFYTYYPVDRAKDAATVVATFADPRARLISSNKEHPYLVTMPYGGGKVVWIGSGEMRRLRQYREAYHERFWTKLARFAGSGNLTRLNRRVLLVMGRTFTANNFVTVEAQIFGRDMLPIDQGATVEVNFKLPPGVTDPALTNPRNNKQRPRLTPKPGAGDWNGWFTGRFLVRNAGEYGIDLQVRETGDTASGKFQVKEPNPELDNTRPNFAALYNLASEADEYLKRVDKQTERKVRQYLQRPRPGTEQSSADRPKDAAPAGEEEKVRFYFDLNGAELIPECMISDSKLQRSRGPVKDLWDDGYLEPPFAATPEPPQKPVKLVTVMSVLVFLLGLEWLIRKLLRLA